MNRLLCVGGFLKSVFDIVDRQCEHVNILSPSESLEYISSKKESVHAVLMSLRMEEMDGIETMEKMHRIDPDIPVIISTHDTSVAVIVNAMQHGAFNYLYEPRIPEELPYVLNRAFSYMHAVRDNHRFQKEKENREYINRIIGVSPSILEIRNTISNIADSSLPILITGESGTGKEVAARTIHSISPRKKRQFIAVNCGAFSSTLLEAELFGYNKGAFTGAESSHAGLFEQAHNGTLFLDEIGLTGTDFQVKLLRVLENGEVRRIGDEQDRRFNVRIITATNENLKQDVKEGNFRQDLYYRLNVVAIHIPPLRNRREDIAMLARYFLQEACTEDDSSPSSINPAALAALEQYDWPGNGRELRNVIQRAALFSNKEEIQVHDLPEHVSVYPDKSKPDRNKGLYTVLKEMETRLISSALQNAEGNRSQAAKTLKINRTTLIEKMKRLGIK